MNNSNQELSRPRVFVAYSYDKKPHAEGERSPKDYGNNLCHILKAMDFEVLTGESRKRHGRLEETVLREISLADWVVILFCPRSKLTSGKHSTSPWVLEEKGAAIALGKNFQIVAHEDVDDTEIGGLHGSAYRIIFTQEDEVERFCEVANVISEFFREQAITNPST